MKNRPVRRRKKRLAMSTSKLLIILLSLFAFFAVIFATYSSLRNIFGS